MTNNDTQRAFDIQEIINLIDDRQNDNDPRAEEAKKSLEKLRQALQSQAEKDRVMKLMADKGKRVMDLLEKHGGSIVPHLLDTDENAGQEFREALSEYTKLGGTQDE